MMTECVLACQACDTIALLERCPLDPDRPLALYPGVLNKMFESIVERSETQNDTDYKLSVLSRPIHEPLDIENEQVPEWKPWVLTFDSFLSDEESDHLVRFGGEMGYEQSKGVGKMKADGQTGAVVAKERTSKNTWCEGSCYESPITQNILDRISKLVSVPEDNFEYIQLLQYEVGQFYLQHHDYIPHHRRRQCGPRILTFFMYLNDVAEGGETRFPMLNNITVKPKKGRAVLWPSVLSDNPFDIDGSTEHEAMPVIEGTKYGANVWMHLSEFKQAHDNGCV